MRYLFFFLFIGTSLFSGAKTGEIKPQSFQEVWAYVMKGEESSLQPEKPVTDVAYFSLRINDIGRITSKINPGTIRKNAPQNARIHLVISAPANRSLMYWCLGTDPIAKKELIQDIVRASKPFDGVQIDFEGIRKEDGDLYCTFLKDLRKELPSGQVFSVAVPARVREMKDAFPYQKISQIADRVIVMAYDEHWRTGSPGSIASPKWCSRVCAYAKQTIPKEKLIMGIPLYGRVWQKEPVARALKYFQTLDLWKEVGTLVKREDDGTPTFAFEKTIEAVVYYEDFHTLSKKLALYSHEKVEGVALWRLSQEPAALWNSLEISSAKNKN